MVYLTLLLLILYLVIRVILGSSTEVVPVFPSSSTSRPPSCPTDPSTSAPSLPSSSYTSSSVPLTRRLRDLYYIIIRGTCVGFISLAFCSFQLLPYWVCYINNKNITISRTISIILSPIMLSYYTPVPFFKSY